jgi:ribosomal protein S18 acetylase RimI-like enzyme
MSLHFRPIEASEIPALCKLVDVAYARQVKRLFGDSRRGRWVHYAESKVQTYHQREPEGVRVGLWDGDIVSVSVSRSFGSLGWFHTLAVHPQQQGSGMGRQAVQDAQDYLVGRGATIIGLMTWPAALDNIGFYQGLGYRAVGVSVYAYRRSHIALVTGRSPFDVVMLSALWGNTRVAAIEAIRELCADVLPGLDYTPWLLWAAKQRLGDVMLFGRQERLVGLGLCYTGQRSDWLEGKLLLIHPDTNDSERLWMLEHLRKWAAKSHRGSFGFPLDLMHADASALFQRNDFRLFHDSMLNMVRGEPWPLPGAHLVRFSG